MHRITAITLTAIIGLSVTLGCGKRPAGTESQRADTAAPRQETVTQGPVTVTLTVTPGSVFLDRDILLTLRATSPENVTVDIPPIHDRLLGFLDAGHFDREPVRSDSGVTTERVVRLTPLIADEYRIAPMAITYSHAPNSEHHSPAWLATPPIVLPMNAVTDQNVGDDIKTSLYPVWVRPSMRTATGYLALLMLLAAVGFVIWKLIRRAHRRIRLMRMSPRERALEELNELLAKHLVENNRVKDFYVELTMVVRRYIERQHHIRAPEQTTEEFLAAVSSDPRFDATVVKRLRSFLEAADLVKFAAYHPDGTNIDGAIDTAKSYITTDADQYEAAEGVSTIVEHKEKLL
jgi:hypothetical protein